MQARDLHFPVSLLSVLIMHRLHLHGMFVRWPDYS